MTLNLSTLTFYFSKSTQFLQTSCKATSLIGSALKSTKHLVRKMPSSKLDLLHHLFLLLSAAAPSSLQPDLGLESYPNRLSADTVADKWASMFPP